MWDPGSQVKLANLEEGLFTMSRMEKCAFGFHRIELPGDSVIRVKV